jgi:hypothetical protein
MWCDFRKVRLNLFATCTDDNAYLLCSERINGVKNVANE